MERRQTDLVGGVRVDSARQQLLHDGRPPEVGRREQARDPVVLGRVNVSAGVLQETATTGSNRVRTCVMCVNAFLLNDVDLGIQNGCRQIMNPGMKRIAYIFQNRYLDGSYC